MLRATLRKSKANQRISFHGIGAFAALHNVSRSHAWRVLSGQRESKKLLKAWRQFRKDQAA